MDAVSIINRLSRTTKRTEKEQILMDAFMKGHREFFIGAQLCYDILTTFGVQKVGEITDEDDGDAGTLSFSDFLDLANKLRTRKLTGYAARDAILDAADKCHIPTWNVFYRRVLLKDLKAGIDVKTINKVLQKLAPTQDDAKKYIIPVFSCQLAHDGMKPEYQKKLSGEKMLDVKLDGCLSARWIVEFADGRKISIAEVVNNKISGKIKSKNMKTNEIEFNEILNWAKNGIDVKEKNIKWFKITLENGIVLPPLTGNHLVWLPKLKCWRRVDLLRLGDQLLSD